MLEDYEIEQLLGSEHRPNYALQVSLAALHILAPDNAVSRRVLALIRTHPLDSSLQDSCRL